MDECPVLYDESDSPIRGQNQNILNIAGKYERIQYFPPYTVSPYVSFPLHQNYRLLCGNSMNQSKASPFILRDNVCCSINPASEEMLISLYQFISSLDLPTSQDWKGRDVFHPSWFPFWVLPSYLPLENPVPLSQFTITWKQYLSSLTPGEGLHHNYTFIDLPESDEVKELFHSLFSSLQSLQLQDLFKDEISLQTLLVSFNVFQMTENRESQVVQNYSIFLF